MSDLDGYATFTVGFPTHILKQADEFSHLQSSTQQAEQVYLNTLAVYTVSFYCDCIEIETSLNSGDVWQPIMQTLLDTADLETPYGKIECRPILPGQDACSIPPEAMSQRMGYMLVEIDKAKREATLLGYRKTAGNGLLSRSDLSSLDVFIDDQMDAIEKAEKLRSRESLYTKLHDWIDGMFDDLWQEPRLLFAYNHRGIESPSQVEQLPERAKRLTIGDIGLILAVKLETETEKNILIEIQVHASGDRVLPSQMLIELIDDSGEVVGETSSGEADNYRSLKFRIGREEKFGIRVTIGPDQETEWFVS